MSSLVIHCSILDSIFITGPLMGWNGPLMHISFLWRMKQFRSPGAASISDKTDTDEKQKFCITHQREKP